METASWREIFPYSGKSQTRSEKCRCGEIIGLAYRVGLVNEELLESAHVSEVSLTPQNLLRT